LAGRWDEGEDVHPSHPTLDLGDNLEIDAVSFSKPATRPTILQKVLDEADFDVG
jgi:hypothetical protein